MSLFGVDAALRTQALAVSGVSALLGDRLYPDAAPQGVTAPYGTLTFISSQRERSRNNGGLKTWRSRYQFDLRSATAVACQAVANLIAARTQDGGLDGFKGTMGTGETSVFVQSLAIENVRRGYAPPVGAEAVGFYAASFDAVIVFNE